VQTTDQNCKNLSQNLIGTTPEDALANPEAWLGPGKKGQLYQELHLPYFATAWLRGLPGHQISDPFQIGDKLMPSGHGYGLQQHFINALPDRDSLPEELGTDIAQPYRVGASVVLCS